MRLFLNFELPRTRCCSTKSCGLVWNSDLPGAYPEKQATIAEINTEMLSHSPRHAIEILGRKNGPDEQMRTQSCTCKHDRQKATGDKNREYGQMLSPLFMPLSPTV